ncbi:hypothetical protein [uncultured Methylobacterium sp.]|jgi:hypothetical protein|uniref:hypothetical protein n=1 Tax=uncultured Methylobacterium sp. TaxID=157278 RepID=UPI002620F9F1|nr:hypothetical protein [uncultured Methylobacterium sp.]
MTAERDALIAAAQRIGADPLDLATVISYETGGTMSPGIRGGAGNRHIGLIQFGIPEQQRYGASQGQSFGEQLGAVESYLTDRGFKPGMGLLDLYSTINAGRPGRYGASDAGNGGAPGTVADKVNFQMGRHRDKAAAFLGGDFTPQAPRGGGAPAPFGFTAPAAANPGAGAAPEPAPAGDDYAEMSRLLASLTRAPSQDAEAPAAPQAPQMPAPTRSAPQFDASRFFALLPRRA